MKKIGNTLFGVGATLIIISCCCLDSPSYIFGAIGFIGIALLYAGYKMGGNDEEK